jgi:hypothetical protein
MIARGNGAPVPSGPPEQNGTRHAYDWTTELSGVFARHAADCPVREGGECTCGRLGYRASVRSNGNVRSLSPVMGTLADAVAWQRHQQSGAGGAPGANEDHAARPARQDGPLVAERPVLDERSTYLAGPAVRATEPQGDAVRPRNLTVDDWLRDFSARYDREHTEADEPALRPPRVTAPTEVPGPRYPTMRRPETGFERDEGPLVRSFVGRFIQAAEDGTAGDLTGRRYERADLRELRDRLRYVETRLGDLHLRGVRPADVQELVSRLTDEGMHPQGVSLVVESLSALFAHAWRLGLVDDSPVAGVTLPDLSAPVVQPPFSPYPNLPPAPAPAPLQAPAPSFASFVAPAAPPAAAAGPMTMTSAVGLTGAPGVTSAPGAANAAYDATMQERWLWWTARIIVIVFVLIALVLAAESI